MLSMCCTSELCPQTLNCIAFFIATESLAVAGSQKVITTKTRSYSYYYLKLSLTSPTLIFSVL